MNTLRGGDTHKHAYRHRIEEQFQETSRVLAKDWHVPNPRLPRWFCVCCIRVFENFLDDPYHEPLLMVDDNINYEK